MHLDTFSVCVETVQPQGHKTFHSRVDLVDENKEGNREIKGLIITDKRPEYQSYAQAASYNMQQPRHPFANQGYNYGSRILQKVLSLGSDYFRATFYQT